jgi:hypothetical protein
MIDALENSAQFSAGPRQDPATRGNPPPARGLIQTLNKRAVSGRLADTVGAQTWLQGRSKRPSHQRKADMTKILHNETTAAMLAGVAGFAMWAAFIAVIASRHAMPVW